MRAMNPKSGAALRATTLLLLAILSAVSLPAQESAVELGRNQSGSLEAALTEEFLQVRGVTPGGEVAYLGANLDEQRESWASVRTYSGLVTDTDADGQVEVSPHSGISKASIWIALDLASGEAVGLSPGTFRPPLPKEMDIEVAPSRRTISVDRRDLEFLLYRPKVGVWFGKGVDGGAGDENLHADESLRVDLSVFRPLGQGGPAVPSAVLAGDRLFAVDLDRFDAVSVDVK